MNRGQVRLGLISLINWLQLVCVFMVCKYDTVCTCVCMYYVIINIEQMDTL